MIQKIGQGEYDSIEAILSRQPPPSFPPTSSDLARPHRMAGVGDLGPRTQNQSEGGGRAGRAVCIRFPSGAGTSEY